MEKITKRFQQISYKTLFMTSRVALSSTSILLFLAWLMFINNNFYPKYSDSLTAKIMNTPIDIMIWPVTLIILFIFILPIWVTNSSSLLFIFLGVALIVMILNSYFLFGLNINSYWIYWLLVDILNFIIIFFALFVLSQKNKRN